MKWSKVYPSYAVVLQITTKQQIFILSRALEYNSREVYPLQDDLLRIKRNLSCVCCYLTNQVKFVHACCTPITEIKFLLRAVVLQIMESFLYRLLQIKRKFISCLLLSYKSKEVHLVYAALPHLERSSSCTCFSLNNQVTSILCMMLSWKSAEIYSVLFFHKSSNVY